MSQSLEEVRLEFSNGVVHTYIRNFEYTAYVGDAEVASAQEGDILPALREAP